MLKGQASTFYYNYLVGKGYNFNRIIYKLKCHFKCYGPSVISVTVTKGGYLSGSGLYRTSETIERGVAKSHS